MMMQPLWQRIPFVTVLCIFELLLLFRNSPLNAAEIVTEDVRDLQSMGASNDVCDTAEPIAIGVPFFINSNSTPESIANDCIAGTFSFPPYNGVWYTFQGTGQRLSGRSCGANNGEVGMSVFVGPCTSLQCVAGEVGLCRGAFFFFDTVVGITYHVLVQIPSQPRRDDYATIDVAPPPPSNDACANAIPIAMDSKVSVNASYATAEARFDGCSNDGAYNNYPGVWYSFVGTGGRVVVRSCSIRSLSTTTISILEGSCNEANLCVAATENPCSTERFSLNTVQGTTYYVLLRTDYFFTTELILDLSVSKAAATENDFCENAQPISFGSRVRANVLAATGDTLDCSGVFGWQGFGNPGVWYTFVGNGQRVVGRLLSPCDSKDDTSIVVTSSGCDRSNLNCVAASQYFCRDRVFFPTVKGTTYHILVQTKNPEQKAVLRFTTCGLFRLGVFCPSTLREILREQFPCFFGGYCCGLFESSC